MITRSMARKRTVEEGKGLESESLTPKEKGPRKQESLKKNKEFRIQLSGSICMFLDQKISKHGGIYEGEQRHGDFASLAIAIKLVEKNKQNLTEARILAKLNHHSHVISSIDSGFYHNGLENHIYIALDRCHNENLREYVTNRKKQGIPFDLNRTTEIENQIITGVEYIHSKKIIHKDLKPDNILFSLDQKLIKIADFGLSEEIDSVSAEVFVSGQFGTAGYRPPESFGKSIISLKSDIYSLGIIFYYISSNGEHPFGDDSDAWNYNMKNGIMDLSNLLVPNPKTTQHLIECMIEIRLNDRPTIWQVSRHPCWCGNEVECDFDYCCDEASNAPTYDEEETLCPNIDDLWKLVEMLQQRTLKTNSAQDGQMLMNISGQEEAAVMTMSRQQQAQQAQSQQQQQGMVSQQGMASQQGMVSQQGMMMRPMQTTQSIGMQQQQQQQMPAPQMQAGMQQMRQFSNAPMPRGPPSDSPQGLSMQSPLSSAGIGYSPDNRIPHPSPGTQYYTHIPLMQRPPQLQQPQQPQLRMPDNPYPSAPHGSVGSTYIPSLSPAHPNNSPQVSAMSPALRTPGSVSVAHSPASAAVPSPLTTQNQSNIAQNEEQMYMEKLKQLQKYIDPLSRMINKEKNSKDLSKMKSLRDVLFDPNKRLAMPTLLKCEKVLQNWLEKTTKPQPQDVQAGMFFADNDIEIAYRIKDKIHDAGYDVDLCDFFDGGLPKPQRVEDFLSSNNVIFWLATKQSAVDAFMTFIQHCGLFKAIEDKRFCFVILQPEEYLKLKLPTILNAYTTLKEDSSFGERLKKTLQSVAKKISRKDKLLTEREVASTDTDNQLAVEGVEIGFEEGTGSCAQPSCTTVLETRPEDGVPNVYNITIQGSNNQIQVGPESQIIIDNNTNVT